MWAKGVHELFDLEIPLRIDTSLLDYEQKCIVDLNDLAALTRKDLSSLFRKVLCALITIDVHARDTINHMVEKHVQRALVFSLSVILILIFLWFIADAGSKAVRLIWDWVGNVSRINSNKKVTLAAWRKPHCGQPRKRLRDDLNIFDRRWWRKPKAGDGWKDLGNSFPFA